MTAPFTREIKNPNGLGHVTLANPVANHIGVRVFLDGVQIQHVTEVNEQQAWVRVYLFNGEGLPVVMNGPDGHLITREAYLFGDRVEFDFSQSETNYSPDELRRWAILWEAEHANG